MGIPGTSRLAIPTAPFLWFRRGTWWMATEVRQIWQRMIGLDIVGYVDFSPRRNISRLLTSETNCSIPPQFLR